MKTFDDTQIHLDQSSLWITQQRVIDAAMAWWRETGTFGKDELLYWIDKACAELGAVEHELKRGEK